MKNVVAIISLSAYLTHLLGYLVAFHVVQQEIRQEMKQLIMERVSDEECVIIALTNAEKQEVQWEKENEFRYRGGLYDVIRTVTRNDTTYYSCINDIREEQLFASLEREVQRQTSTDVTHSKTTKNDGVRDHLPITRLMLDPIGSESSVNFFLAQHFPSPPSEPPTPPPRIL